MTLARHPRAAVTFAALLLHGSLAAAEVAVPTDGAAAPATEARQAAWRAEPRLEVTRDAPRAGKAASGALAMASASLRSYVDPAYGFRIGYPEGFVVRSRDVSRLTHFTPRPVASVYFMNPTMAAGALAGIEPPDLEIRVYEGGAGDSLGDWLVRVGLASADGVAAAQRHHTRGGAPGLRVCDSTMMAPGCSYYVLGRSSVFQLTPISLEGEAMVKTFSLGP